MPHFMTVLIPYINLLNLFWIIKCLVLKNMGLLSIWTDGHVQNSASDQDLRCNACRQGSQVEFPRDHWVYSCVLRLTLSLPQAIKVAFCKQHRFR